ncbi:unnamed protein product [Soboliphyme baturini]|uniref:Anaphase-promoting complex subunit 5 n=1 Tax=Soboliphyme baturini TaxID=241478 RepID=A0A183IZY0_9BILA|nr:unnamed protein product [Soboliphyme baturini]
MPVLFGMLVSLLSTSLLSFCLHHGTLLFTFSVAYFAAANAYAGLLCILHRNRFDQLLAKLLHLISDMKCFISSTKHILAFIHEREGLMKEYLMLTRQPADSLPARSSYTSDEKEIDLLEFMFLDTDAVTHYLDELTKDSTSFVSLKNLSDSKTSRLSHHFGLPNSATYLKTVLGKILCHVEVAQQSLVDLANSINTDSNLIDVERFGLCYELCGSQLRFAENYLEEISSVVKQQKKEDLGLWLYLILAS